MRPRRLLLYAGTVLATLALGIVANVALFGPRDLLRSPLLGPIAEYWLDRHEGTVAIGAPMPPLQLADLDGTTRTVPRAGHATLVNYWASWCGPCIGEMPLLDALAASRTGAPVVDVVGIALDDPQPVRDFLARQPVRFQVLVETPGANDSSIRMGNHRQVLPFSVLVGADGRVVARHYGPFADASALQRWVAATGASERNNE